MERKIGEQFNDNGVELRVEGGNICENCFYLGRYFKCHRNKAIAGECIIELRPENKDEVIFTEINKVIR